MKTRLRHNPLRAALVIVLATASCSSEGDLDSESHFACRADSDCPVGDRCVAKACADPAVTELGRTLDTVDLRSATTPNCKSRPCTGTLKGVYTARPPVGLVWRNIGDMMPLLSVSADGTIALLFEESGDSGAYTPVVRRLTPALEEISTTRLPSRDNRQELLYSDDGGYAVVDLIYSQGHADRLKIQTFDAEMAALSQREVELPAGTGPQRVSSSGDITLLGMANSSSTAEPLAGCPEINSMLVLSPDNVLTPVLCFRGISAGVVESPSGSVVYGIVEGAPSESRSIDLGGGPVDAAGGSFAVARYDRNLRVVWTAMFQPSDLTVTPASGGAAWSTGNAGMLPLPTPPEEDLRQGSPRRDLMYVDSRGTPQFVDFREGWDSGAPSTDGAGNVVMFHMLAATGAAPDVRYGEIRKLTTDGATAWTIPIDWGWEGGRIAVGPSGDVYFATLIARDRMTYPSAMAVVGDQTFEGPILAVLRFAP